MAIPFLNHITLNQNEARDIVIHKAEAADITTPAAGQIIFDNGTSVNKLKYYDGSAWITLPAVDTDNYVDSASFAGGTLTLGRTGSLADVTVDLSSLDTSFTVTVDSGDTSHVIGNGDTLDISGTQSVEGDGLITVGYTANSGVISIDHRSTTRTNTTGTALTPAHGGSFSVITGVTSTGYGHVSGVETTTITLPSDNNTDTLQYIEDTSNSTEDIDYFITFVSSVGDSAQTGYADTGLKWNPYTDTLTVDNLIVEGTTTTVNTEEINLADNIITLNSNATGSPTENAGLEIERGTEPNTVFRWNETYDDWEFTAMNHAATPAVTLYKVPRTYSTTVGGSTSIAVTHNLGTRNVIVQLFDTSSYETVYADVVRTDTNTITLTFASAPSAGDITVLISTAGA